MAKQSTKKAPGGKRRPACRRDAKKTPAPAAPRSPTSPWSEQEDCQLKCLVAASPPGSVSGRYSWKAIARNLPGRNGKQCRDRWHNRHAPGVKKGQWTAEEDCRILSLQKQLGNQWAKIAEELPGRTDSGVKNRWHSLSRRHALPKTGRFGFAMTGVTATRDTKARMAKPGAVKSSIVAATAHKTPVKTISRPDPVLNVSKAHLEAALALNAMKHSPVPPSFPPKQSVLAGSIFSPSYLDAVATPGPPIPLEQTADCTPIGPFICSTPLFGGKLAGSGGAGYTPLPFRARARPSRLSFSMKTPHEEAASEGSPSPLICAV